MKQVITRSISGIIYIAIIVAAIYAGESWTSILMAVFGGLAIYEYQKMTIFDQGFTPVRFISFILAELIVLPLILFLAIPEAEIFLMPVPFFIFLRFILALFDKKSPNPLNDLAQWILSIIYISVPLMCAVGLSYHKALLAIFVMIWANDTGAYCVGCTLGKHKLCEYLSPKKTWEGFFGGMLFCIIAGMIFYFIDFIPKVNIITWIGGAFLTCILATVGDLFESMIKRSCGVKDSGSIIPGHGGILDRIDSLLAVAPVIFLYSLFVFDYLI